MDTLPVLEDIPRTVEVSAIFLKSLNSFVITALSLAITQDCVVNGVYVQSSQGEYIRKLRQTDIPRILSYGLQYDESCLEDEIRIRITPGKPAEIINSYEIENEIEIEPGTVVQALNTNESELKKRVREHTHKINSKVIKTAKKKKKKSLKKNNSSNEEKTIDELLTEWLEQKDSLIGVFCCFLQEQYLKWNVLPFTEEAYSHSSNYDGIGSNSEKAQEEVSDIFGIRLTYLTENKTKGSCYYGKLFVKEKQDGTRKLLYKLDNVVVQYFKLLNALQ